MPGGHHGDDVRPASSGVKLTYDDFLLFPDDGKRHELIDGEHYVTPSPNVTHQRVQINLVRALLSYLDAHPVRNLRRAGSHRARPRHAPARREKSR